MFQNHAKLSIGDDVTPTVWSIVEVCVAMICACLPAIRALLSYWFPSFFEMTSKMPSKNVNSSVHLESKTNWRAGRKPHEVDDEIIMMSNVPSHKGGLIAKFEDPDDVPPPTRPKTAGSQSENSEWRPTSQGSDEVEFLDARTAVPLRNLPGNHVITPMAVSKSHLGR
jgi:hypothetical protein